MDPTGMAFGIEHSPGGGYLTQPFLLQHEKRKEFT